MSQQLSLVNPSGVEFAIQAWLHEKAGRSGSEGTLVLYFRHMQSFRAELQRSGLDVTDSAKAVRVVAQAWASKGHDETGVSGATYNNRLSALSSFYDYCASHEMLGIEKNPVQVMQKRKVQPYRSAQALDPNDVMRKLKAIDRSSLKGQRDFALLAICLVTGRRLSEIARLERMDISVGESVVLTWRRVKGGNEQRDRLPWAVGRALLEYLESLDETYGEQPSVVWVSLSRNGTVLHPLSLKALANICEDRIGVSKFHVLRHTFAHAMEDSGAKVSDIQARLGHSNIATTGRYLASLRREENQHADELARLFGLN